MDWGKAFTYVFDDRDWVSKLLIGGLLGLIPIVNLAVLGYTLAVIKNVADGVEQPLPAWDDFGRHLVQGLMAALGALVWATPLILLALVLGVVSAVTGYDSQSGRAVSDSVGVAIAGLSCLAVLYGVFLGLVLPAATTRYAISGRFAEFFRFGNLFSYIVANLGYYVIALLLSWMAQFVAGFGVILCFIGLLFTEFWSSLVGSHLLGQVYRQSARAPEEAEFEPAV